MKHDPELWRDRFPILESTTYLVNHSLGAMPRTVYDKLREFADQWATRGVRAWGEGWWSSPVDVGNVVGRIMNAFGHHRTQRHHGRRQRICPLG